MRKKIKKDYKIETLMILLLVFVLTIAYYTRIQNMLILESNRLLTNNAVSIQGNDHQISTLATLNGINYRIFVVLYEANNNRRVYAFYTPSPSSWLPPMSEGDFFSENDTQEAIVGRHVPIEKTVTGNVYFFNDQAYEVIGFLGLTTPSLLDETVLLNTSQYLNTNSELIVDYDRAGVLAGAFGEEASIQARGALRLLAVDFFTPLIVAYSQIIAVLAIVVIAYLFFLKIQSENTTRHLIGENSIKIFRINIFVLFRKWLLFSVPLFILIRLELFQNILILHQWLTLSLLLVASYSIVYFGSFRLRGSKL